VALGFCFKGDGAISHEQEPGEEGGGKSEDYGGVTGQVSFFRPRTGTEAEMLGASIE